jgi:hypothetical protein
MDTITWMGVFGLTVVILGGIAASLFTERNDEMQSGGHH